MQTHSSLDKQQQIEKNGKGTVFNKEMFMDVTDSAWISDSA